MTTRDGINYTLKLIGAVGFTGLVIFAPNSLQALEKLTKKSKNKVNNKKVLYELKRQGLVMVSSQGNKTKFSLTPAGAYRLQKLTIDELQIATPKRWDKKWRMVSFDIPNQHSKSRVYFTQHLTGLGLVMLQKSIWVHPYECFDELNKIADYYNIKRYCSFFVASEIDQITQNKLKKRFNLT